MEIRNSITISKDILTTIDQIIGKTKSRSEFIEELLCKYLLERSKK